MAMPQSSYSFQLVIEVGTGKQTGVAQGSNEAGEITVMATAAGILDTSEHLSACYMSKVFPPLT